MTDFGQRLVAEIPALRRYARVLLRQDPDQADDLVQDCLERAVSRRARWQEGNLRAWLFTIMHNLHLNNRRYAGRRPGLVPLDPASDLAVPPAQGQALEAARLARAFDELSDEHRAVLLMVAVEGLAYREAAEILEVPIGTVMSRLARARERLRALMEDGGTLRRVK